MTPTTVLVDVCSALVERVSNSVDSSAARVTRLGVFGRAVRLFRTLAFGILYFRALTFGILCRFATSDGLIVANKAGLVVNDEALAGVAVTELDGTRQVGGTLSGAGGHDVQRHKSRRQHYGDNCTRTNHKRRY
jgi:hypothetical protein